jgi:hypothetical protein
MQDCKKPNNKKLLIDTLLLVACLFVFFCLDTKAEDNEISELYIEASGNNKYEAKIKAHEFGMKRALYLLANKFNIPIDSLKEIPYHKIKRAFSPKNILDEVSLLEKYSATVTYSYKKGIIYNLLLEYGGEKVNDLFYEAIILPVFKQGKKLNIWNSDKRWNNFWNSSREILDKHKIYYPEQNLYLSEKINQSNLFKLNFEDFINIFHDKLFKNLIIITSEFFTNRETGESLLLVKRHSWNPYSESANIVEEEYELNSWDDVQNIVDLVIDKIMNDYGVTKFETKNKEMDDGHLLIEENEKKPVIMNFEVFDQEELDMVIKKLEQVDQIENFAIEHDSNTKYKILIYTSAAEDELAEGLYLNGLSYRIHGNLYNLIDVKKGG